MVDARVKMYCDAIFISDVIIRRVNLEIALFSQNFPFPMKSNFGCGVRKNSSRESLYPWKNTDQLFPQCFASPNSTTISSVIVGTGQNRLYYISSYIIMKLLDPACLQTSEDITSVRKIFKSLQKLYASSLMRSFTNTSKVRIFCRVLKPSDSHCYFSPFSPKNVLGHWSGEMGPVVRWKH